MAIYRMPVNLTWPGSGGPGSNIWHIRNDDGVDPAATLGDAADAIRTFYSDLCTVDWGGNQAGIFAQGYTVTCEGATELGTDQFVPVTWPAVVSASGSAPAPTVLQVVITWQTSISARRGRGRTFLGPLGAGVIDSDGTPKAGVMNLIGTAATDLLSASVSTNNWAIGVYGLETSGTGPDGPRVFRDATGMRASDKFAVLRSRRD